jgi:hypothetical protein
MLLMECYSMVLVSEGSSSVLATERSYIHVDHHLLPLYFYCFPVNYQRVFFQVRSDVAFNTAF